MQEALSEHEREQQHKEGEAEPVGKFGGTGLTRAA